MLDTRATVWYTSGAMKTPVTICRYRTAAPLVCAWLLAMLAPCYPLLGTVSRIADRPVYASSDCQPMPTVSSVPHSGSEFCTEPERSGMAYVDVIPCRFGHRPSLATAHTQHSAIWTRRTAVVQPRYMVLRV